MLNIFKREKTYLITWILATSESTCPSFGCRAIKTSKTGIDLLGESTGILFDVDKIGNVETATTSFGQGISTTPIQIVKVNYPSRCEAVITEAYYKTPSTTDLLPKSLIQISNFS